MAAPKKRWVIQWNVKDGPTETLVVPSKETISTFTTALVERGNVEEGDITVYELGKRVPIKIERNVTVTVGK